jgi:hypothetical protein
MQAHSNFQLHRIAMAGSTSLLRALASRVHALLPLVPQKGTWAKLLAAVSDEPNLEYLMVDGSIVRVHPQRRGKKTAIS